MTINHPIMTFSPVTPPQGILTIHFEQQNIMSNDALQLSASPAPKIQDKRLRQCPYLQCDVWRPSLTLPPWWVQTHHMPITLMQGPKEGQAAWAERERYMPSRLLHGHLLAVTAQFELNTRRGEKNGHVQLEVPYMLLTL
jgi:hypothetical protein